MSGTREMTTEEERFLKDVDICIRLLETLKEDCITPGCYDMINTSKATRVRLTIHELLKKY